MSSQPTEIDNKNIHISCVRMTPLITEKKDVGEVLYEQGHITVMTSGPALPITIPKVVKTYYVTPPGAVIAFAGSDCPKGWEKYSDAENRFILGSSVEHPLHAMGGRADIPEGGKHSHATGGIIDGNWEMNGHDRNSDENRNHTHTTDSKGEHNHGGNNMPPFVALKYCMRPL